MTITSCLQNGDFGDLFIEHLGWDRVCGNYNVELAGNRFELEKVAHKRGFMVIRMAVERSRGQTKRFVRSLQTQVARLAHEHLLIIHDHKYDAQVWAWSYRDTKNGQLRHRFHPLLTNRISQQFIDRIKRLTISLEEEEAFTFFDVVNRTHEVLDSNADHEIFFRRLGYAQKSHELALRMRAGGDQEFIDFVLFHQKMASWYARRFKRIVNDEESMMQEAMIGLIRSARKFDPDRGIAFSTYAYRAMKNECFRALPQLVRTGRVPSHVYWPYQRVIKAWASACRTGGVDVGRDALNNAIVSEGLDATLFDDLHRFSCPLSLEENFRHDWSDTVGPVEYTHDVESSGKLRTPLADLIHVELRGLLLDGLKTLDERDELILKARFADDDKPMTLQEIGDTLDLTRERIRQIERKALHQLNAWIQQNYPDEFQFVYLNARKEERTEPDGVE